MPHAEDSADEPMNEIVNTHSSSTKSWEEAATWKKKQKKNDGSGTCSRRIFSVEFKSRMKQSSARNKAVWMMIRLTLKSDCSGSLEGEAKTTNKKNLWIIIIQPERYTEVAIFWKVCNRSKVIKGNKNVPGWPLKQVWVWSAWLKWTFCTWYRG